MRPIGNQCIGVFPPLSQELLIRCSNLITNQVSEFECLLKRQERINDSVSRSPLFLLCLRSEAVGECPVLTRAAHGIYHQSYAQNYEWDAEHLSEIHAVVRNHFIFGADLHVFRYSIRNRGTKMPMKKIPVMSHGRSSALRFQYIHISRAKSKK